MIRVGRCKYIKGKRIDPSFPGFESIVCLTKSSPYGELGPYVLKDRKGRIMENIWQFSKAYKEVPAATQRYSRFDKTIIWNHPAEIHINDKGKLTKAYFNWRKKGMNAKHPIRYPVGMKYRHNCVCAYANDFTKPLDYIESRKKIYLPLYRKLVTPQPKFAKLLKMLKHGKNLLIIEVDGPHQESLGYYKKKYNVSDKFIENGTILVNTDNMKIMLNDDKHPFGHGYCLGISLLVALQNKQK